MLTFSSILLIIKGLTFDFLKRVRPKLDFLNLENKTALALSCLSIVFFLFFHNEIFAYLLITIQFPLQIQGLYSWMLSTTQTLTLDENKKHYGKINAANSLGKIAGFILVPFLILLISEASLLLFALFFQIVTFILLNHVRAMGNEQIKNSDSFASSQAKWDPAEIKLVALAIPLVFIATIVAYSSAIYGIQSLKELLPNPTRLAFYLSGVNLIRSMLEFFSRLTYPTIIKNYGIIGGFSTLPLLYFIFFSFYFIGINAQVIGLVAWVMLYTSFSAYFNPTFFHTLSVIPSQKRATCMNIFGNILLPTGSMLGNGMFALILALYPKSPTPHYLFLCAFSLSIMLMILYIKTPYLQQLKRLITKQITSSSIENLSQKEEKVILNKLDDVTSKELLYLLNLLDEFSHSLRNKILEAAFESQDSIVHLCLLDKELPSDQKTVEQLYHLLKTSSDKVKVLSYRKLLKMKALKFDVIEGTFLETLNQIIETQNSELILSHQELFPFYHPGDISMEVLKKIYDKLPEKVAPLLCFEKNSKMDTFFLKVLKEKKAVPFFERLKQVPKNAPYYIELTLQNFDQKSTPWENLIDVITLLSPEKAVVYLKKLLAQAKEFEIQKRLFSELSSPKFLLISPINQPFFQLTKQKLFNEIGQLMGIKKTFPSSSLLLHSANLRIKESYKTLLSIWAIETKESVFTNLNLWNPALDPFRKSFQNEFLTHHLRKKDYETLQNLKPEEINIKVCLENKRFSDVIKAGLIYESKYKKQIIVDSPSMLIQETMDWLQK
jgi:hypothetical protein